MMKNSFNCDEFGVKYHHPERTCKACKNYPCRDDLEVLDTDFAKYGCIKFE